MVFVYKLTGVMLWYLIVYVAGQSKGQHLP